MNKLLIVIPLVVVGIIAALALSPYFTESTIDEALPPGAITQSEMMKDEMMEGKHKMDDGTMMDDDMMEGKHKMDDGTMMDDDMMMNDTMATKGSGSMDGEMVKDDTMKDDEMMEDEMVKEGTMIEEEMMKDDTMKDDDTMMNEGTVMSDEMMKPIPMSYAGTFVGVGDGIHDARGDAYTIPLEDTSNVLRLENFRSTNGPDLYVYLSADKRASDFVSLGALKANNGNQNYDIPEGTDLDKYNKVLIWCDLAGVLFGSAELSTK